MNIAEQLQTIADNVPKVYQAGYDDGAAAGGGGGGDNHYDTFWDAFQNNGKRTLYTYAFSYEGWTDNSYNPKYDIVCVGTTASMFQYSDITDTKRTIDLTQATDMGATFRRSPYLKTIRKLIVSEATPFNANTFQGANGLENITFEGVIGYSLSFVDSPLLTTASVQSIIDHLKDLTGATAQTLTFHKDVGAKLTQAQKDTISAKNWTQVY